MNTHEVEALIRKDDGFVHTYFVCRACTFDSSDLTEIAKHVVQNQFEVKYDPSHSKLGGASDAHQYPRKLQSVRDSKRERKYNMVPRS